MISTFAGDFYFYFFSKMSYSHFVGCGIINKSNRKKRLHSRSFRLRNQPTTTGELAQMVERSLSMQGRGINALILHRILLLSSLEDR